MQLLYRFSVAKSQTKEVKVVVFQSDHSKLTSYAYNKCLLYRKKLIQKYVELK